MTEAKLKLTMALMNDLLDLAVDSRVGRVPREIWDPWRQAWSSLTGELEQAIKHKQRETNAND